MAHRVGVQTTSYFVTGQRTIRRADGETHPFLHRIQCRPGSAAAREPHRHLLAIGICNWQEGGNDFRRRVNVAGIADDQAVVRVEHSGRTSAQRAGTRDIADIQLEVLHFVEDRRVVKHALIIRVVRAPSTIQWHRLTRARAKLPDVAIGETGKVTTGAVLPAFAGKPIDLAAFEDTARREEDLGADLQLFFFGSRAGEVRQLENRFDGVRTQVDHRDITRNVVHHKGARIADHDTQRILAGLFPLRGWV